MALSSEDRQAVHDLMVRYTFAVDAKPDAEVLLPLFTDDFEVNGPLGFARGAAAVDRLLNNKDFETLESRHILTNVLIDGDGDHARIRAYFLRFRYRIEHVEGERPELTLGTYDCAALKTARVWKLHRRTVSFTMI